LVLLFALSDPIPNSAEDGVFALIIVSLGDTSIIGNGGLTHFEEADIIGQGGGGAGGNLSLIHLQAWSLC
jgi:hypothetical protein